MTSTTNSVDNATSWLRERIGSGDYKTGARLPSILAINELFFPNARTDDQAHRVYQPLIAEGTVYWREGPLAGHYLVEPGTRSLTGLTSGLTEVATNIAQALDTLRDFELHACELISPSGVTIGVSYHPSRRAASDYAVAVLGELGVERSYALQDSAAENDAPWTSPNPSRHSVRTWPVTV